MDATSLSVLARWTGGHLSGGNSGTVASRVCTDSRSLEAGDLFVALRGDRFDGHGFVAEAARLGAVGAIVEEVEPGLPGGFATLQVPNSLLALQSMASGYRRTLPLKVVAITGSNGKTSTKDLTAAVLGERFKVTRTEGNLNNHIGLALTVLRAGATDEVGVFEIGMNHAGEIAPLAAIAAPDMAIITNIGMAHIEYLGSRAAIAQEKGMLAQALPAHGHLLQCAEDEFANSIAARSQAHPVYVGIDSGDVRASDLLHDFDGSTFQIEAYGQRARASIPVPGIHMVRNALLAVGTGLAMGLELEECVAGLGKLRLTKGRLEQKTVGGIRILDDTYNANPDSMKAALRTLAHIPAQGRRIAVVGRMGELGQHSEEGHRSVGEVAAEVGLDVLVGVGEEVALTIKAAQGRGLAKALHAGSIEEALELVRSLVLPGDVVLVKGSRSARMERIVEGLARL